MESVKARPLHEWDLDPSAAQAVQRQLAPLVSRVNEIDGTPRFIAGVDLSGVDAEGEATGAVVVLGFPELEVVEVQTARQRPAIPYVPGLLSFRETPVLLEAFEKLRVTPDLVICDGQGIAHPRRFGIACHLGLLLDVPSIGCAKSILRGRFQELGQEAGSTAELVDKNEVVGTAVRTVAGQTPVYISIGHKVDLPAAVHWAMACVRGRRLPEPTRLAHNAAGGRAIPIAVRAEQV